MGETGIGGLDPADQEVDDGIVVDGRGEGDGAEEAPRARDSTDDKVRGLTLGGDDYLQKPFSLDELVARAEAVLRRTSDPHRNGSVLTCADLRMDDDAHRVQRDGTVRVMDEDEFHAHQLKYNYPPQVVATAQATCDYLAAHIKTTEPFTTAYKPYLSQIRSL